MEFGWHLRLPQGVCAWSSWFSSSLHPVAGVAGKHSGGAFRAVVDVWVT